MANKSTAGFAIIAAALLVPGGMYYYWYTNQQKQQKAAEEARIRMPKDAQIFSAPPSGEKLANPMAAVPAASTATATPATATAGAAPAPPPPGAPSGPPPSAVPAAAASAAPAPAPASASAAAPAPADAAAPAPSLATAVSSGPPGGGLTYANGMLRTGPIAQIILARDPMLSPFDQVRIAEEEARRRRIQEELENARKPKKRTRQVVQEVPAESLVDLQGIVSTGDGDKAIVNGEMVSEGDMVGAVKVVKISASGVVFLHRNKRFIKAINK